MTIAQSTTLPFDESKVDDDAFEELSIYLQCSAEIHRQRIVPMIANVQRRMKAGTYDHSLAPKLWIVAVKDAVKGYKREHGSLTCDLGFTPDTQRKLANDLANEYKDAIEGGEYDDQV